MTRIQRLKANLSSDYAAGRLTITERVNNVPSLSRLSADDWTVGGDLSVVFNPLRFHTPLEVGVRAGYNIRAQQPFVQSLVLNIGF